MICFNGQIGINMKNKLRLQQIREAERNSHIEIYSEKELYESGSWLQKPIKTVLDLVPLFHDYNELHVLDLGGGVGRNCIPFAQEYSNISCTVECVDILELAIEKLKDNAQRYHIASTIKGIVSSIEDYTIEECKYDLIMAVSALEHVESEEAFVNKLIEIRDGIREKGIVCLVINSEVMETNKDTGESLEPQFEVNPDTEELQAILRDTFADWEIMKTTVRTQQYDIPRDAVTSDLKTRVVTLVARKTKQKM